MALPIEKLEKFGLEEFINVYRFYLCSRTVNQNKVAVALNFDSDECAIITHPPDNFSKCEKLYELIQKKSEVRNFVEALDDTGNEHILKFIKETDLSTTLTSANSNRRRGIWFNIPEPIGSFYGREDFLTQLHDQLKPQDDSETELTVLSQVKIVSGLGGIGKTQTARKYIIQHKKFYNNFIWINAESESSMRNSFLELAKEMNIPVKDSEGNPKEIKQIVKEIYNKICDGGKSNLIVFDNVEDYQSCKNFFPFGLHPELTKPVILATSRNQEWISQTGRITVLPLDVLTYDESLEFILTELEIEDSPEFREESREFIELIGGLPLALQQAVAYVKQQKEVNALLGRPYKMSDYAKEFKSSAEKLQKFPHAPDSSTTVFVTWNLTLKKMKEDPKGEIAIQIIEALSFLYADKIPVEFLLQLLPFPPLPQNWITRLRNSIRRQRQESTDRDLAEGLQILSKFSMIKITQDFVSIHRQVQSVIIQNLKSSGRLNKVFNQVIESCKVILNKMKSAEPEPNFVYTDLFLNLHQLVSNHFEVFPVNDVFDSQRIDISFIPQFGLVLSKAGQDLETSSESLSLLESNQQQQQQLIDRKEKVSLKFLIYFSFCGLVLIGAKSVEINCLKDIESIPLLITARLISFLFKLYLMNKICDSAVKNVLEEVQLNYEVTLEQLQQSLPQVIEQHGEAHPLTIQTRNSIALLQMKMSDILRYLSCWGSNRRRARITWSISIFIVILLYFDSAKTRTLINYLSYFLSWFYSFIVNLVTSFTCYNTINNK